MDDFKDIETNCSFPLIKIIVNKNNNNSVLNPIGCMILFFHTFVHVKNKQSIENYISTTQNKVWLDGFFSISFHFNDKKILLENIKENPGMINLIDKMIEHLTSYNIQQVLNDLI